MRQTWQFGLDSMFREYTYVRMYLSPECLNLRRQKAGYCSFTQKHPPPLPPPPYPPSCLPPFSALTGQFFSYFPLGSVSFPSPMQLLNGTLLRATETSLYVTSLNVNPHKVGVESHKTEMSQNKECFKRRGVQNVYVFFHRQTVFRIRIWIRIRMDPLWFSIPRSESGSAPYWGCGSGIRIQEQGNLLKLTSKPDFHPFKMAFIPP